MNWKATPYYPYEVSDTGVVRNRVTLYELRAYMTGTKRKSGQRFSVSVQSNPHRMQGVGALVLSAFIRTRRDGEVVMHKDDNPRNNRLENLRWGTPTENAQDMARKGRQHLQRIDAEGVRTIKEMRAAGIYGTDVAALFDISAQRVCDIYKGRTTL
ncbi:HNH nuclease [uncultured Caudovirales phage]|uniref:HNH nuclease n=1 Tax=uncultured Caudovirales phage TaxID=2100421 RepID=A0A6J5T9F6_9CAUD|nr:HNH nuclease [uncultured Caudovirales phage]CAB5218951.1 HNH nuclease [uncultured Caudovirales phage]